MEGNGRKLHAIHAAQGEGSNPRTLRGVLFAAQAGLGAASRLVWRAGCCRSLWYRDIGSAALFKASPEMLDII